MTEKAKHTPGPWLQEGRAAAIIHEDEGVICLVSSTEANARLITAAPELLDVLKSIIESVDEWHYEEYDGRMEGFCPYCGNEEEAGHSETCERSKALRLIAKAAG